MTIAPSSAADRLLLQQPLVDRAELLDRHVAVVDEAAPVGGFSVAKVVDDRGDHRVGQAGPRQQRGGLVGEQAAVVGRQADGRVALVDELPQLHQAVVVGGGHGREGGAGSLPVGDIIAYRLAQAVVFVTGVVDGEQPAVLGVEHEQQPVEEDQRGIARLRQRYPWRAGECGYKPGEDLIEDHAGEVPRHLLLVAAALGQCVLEKGGGGPLGAGERVAAEQQVEGAQGVCVASAEQLPEVGFEVAGGARAGALVVEPPHAAVGQEPPADPALRRAVGA